MNPASSSAFTRSGPNPRMSIAGRDAKWTMLSNTRPGQETLGQYAITSSRGCSTFDLQMGQRPGGWYGRLRRTPFLITGPSTCGMTSPARVTSTRSPSRMSLALITAKSCSVAGDTVGAVVELLEQRLERAGDFAVGGREVGDERVVRLDRESPGGELGQQVVLGRDRELLAGGFDVEAEDPQAAAARDFGIELAQRAGGGVAGIGEGRLPRALALLVELGEAGLGEVHLAAYFHELGPGLALAVQPQRHVEHGAQVGGDVLAFDAVAAGRARDAHAVLVGETHRRAVDLHLQGVARGL